MEAVQAALPADPQVEVPPVAMQEIPEIIQEIQELTPVEITAETIPAIHQIIPEIAETIPAIQLTIPEIPAIPLLPPIFRRKRMESRKRSPEPETMAIPKRSPVPEKAESRKRILLRSNLRKRMLLSWWEKPRLIRM